MRIQSIYIFLYLGFNVLVVTLALTVKESSGLPKVNGHTNKVVDTTSNLSYFTKPIFYILKDTKPYLHMNATELTLNSKTQNVVFLEPSGSLFDKDGVPLRFEGSRGLLKRDKGILELTSNININFVDTKLNSGFFKYYFDDQKIEAWENVKTNSLARETKDKIFIESDFLTTYTKNEVAKYKGHVKGEILRQKAYEEKVSFETKNLLAELKISKLTLTGNVHMKKQGFSAKSKRGEVFLKNYNKKLKYYVLYDDVVVVEEVVVDNSNAKAPAKRRAFAEKLEGFMNDNLVVLTGYPKVYSAGDVIKGNRIVLRQDTDVIEVDDAITKFKLR